MGPIHALSGFLPGRPALSDDLLGNAQEKLQALNRPESLNRTALQRATDLLYSVDAEKKSWYSVFASVSMDADNESWGKVPWA